MPRLDIAQAYTKRAYYFGIIALISFLVMRSLVAIKMLTKTDLPSALFLLILTIHVFCSASCIYTAYKARKEHNSFKKVIAILLAIGSFVSIVLLIIEAYRSLL